MISYEIAKTTLTEAATLTALLAALATAGVQTAGLGDFSAELALIRLNATALSQQQEIRASLARAISLAEAALAGRSYLERVALGRFDERPIAAIKAVWSVEVTNLTASPITVAAYELIAEGTGELFQNTSGFTLPGLSSINPLFEALTAGQAGIVSVGAIDQLR